MTVVVADTSPLNYLVQIEAIDILPRLYGKIVIPKDVLSELTVAPRAVAEWASALPQWVDVRLVRAIDDPVLTQLDAGDRVAITLALSEADVLLLIDEAAGRFEASEPRHHEHRDARRSSRSVIVRVGRPSICSRQPVGDQLSSFRDPGRRATRRRR